MSALDAETREAIFRRLAEREAAAPVAPLPPAPRRVQAPPGRFDLELRRMMATQAPGQAFTLTEIARFCGVSHQYVAQVELRALSEFREKMPAEMRDVFLTQ